MDMALNMTTNYHGINSLTQAVGQAKLIDKFMINEKQLKNEIKFLIKNFNEIESKFQGLYEEAKLVKTEKVELEKVILEILNFGDQCDKQFEVI